MLKDYKLSDNGYYLFMHFDNISDVKGDKNTLSAWLSYDVENYHPILDDVIKVLDGNSEYEELWCNLFTADVYKDYTEIHSNFGDIMPHKPCKVPTPLLREIIEVWLEEREKYYANKK